MAEPREVSGEPQAGTPRGPQSLLLDAYREAERALREELELHPQYADLHHRLGLLHLARGDWEAAQGCFEEALGLNPGYRAAYYGQRLALLRRGLLDPESEPAQSQEGQDLKEALHGAVDRLLRREASGADAESACAGLDGVARAHYAAGLAARRGDDQGVRRELEEGARASETTRALFEAWGWLPWKEGAAREVADQLRDQLWTPLAADLYSYVGRIYGRNGLRQEAAAAYDRAYLVHPRAAAHACDQAELAVAFGDERRALELLRAAVSEEPDYARGRIALGFEYASQGYREEARQELERAVALAPGYADVRYNLGLLHLSADRPLEALEQFRSALAINPAYLPARHSMASLLCRTGRHEEGLREYQRIMRQGFQSADMLVRMGRAALALQRTDEALQLLERAAFLNPDYAATHFYLGTVYRRKGLRRKAHGAWRRYLEMAGECDALADTPGAAGGGV